MVGVMVVGEGRCMCSGGGVGGVAPDQDQGPILGAVWGKRVESEFPRGLVVPTVRDVFLGLRVFIGLVVVGVIGMTAWRWFLGLQSMPRPHPPPPLPPPASPCRKSPRTRGRR